MTERETRISDHKMLHIWLGTKVRVDRRIGKLKGTPDWRKPEEVQAAYWRKVLCEAWEEMQESETRSSLEEALEKEEVKVEEEWEQLNRALMDLFARGFRRLEEEAKEKGKEELAKKYKEKAETKLTKGGVGKHVWTPLKASGLKDNESMQVKKTRNWIGRVLNARQQVKKHGPEWLRKPENRKAVRRVWGHKHPKAGEEVEALKVAVERTRKVQEVLLKLEHAAKEEKLEAWRIKMQKGVVEVSNWLKRKKESVTMPVIKKNGQIKETLPEALEAIREHWQEVWAPQKTEEAKVRRQAAVELMAAEYESDQVEVEWSDPTEEETVKAMKGAKGSGGVDGWVGEEIKYLPEQVANSFRKLAMRWQQAQQVADALKETRQANLTKPGKVKNGGLEAGDTRPINVECIWWRIWGTAWVKSQPVAEWRKTNIPEEVLGGAGSKGAEEAGADTCDDVAQQGFGGTLDFSLCYDHAPRGHV